MASMVSRFALSMALLVPAMCAASELAPEQLAWYQARLGIAAAAAPAIPPAPSPAAEAVIEWQALQRDPHPSFERVSAFLIAHPGWPMENDLRKAAEAGLSSDFTPASAVSFFQRFPPTDASGHLHFALALLSAGRTDDASMAARRAWTTGTLDAQEEARLLSNFGAALTPADHDLRMERLLWSGATGAATRQLALTSPDRRAEFEARLALRSRATTAAIRAAEVEGANPDLLRTNAGYIADKVGWLAASGQSAAAQAVLAAPRRLAAPPLDPGKWLDLLLDRARDASRSGQFQTAYDIARQVDDLLPTGSDILAQPQSVRNDYTDLVWLAASTAHRQLARPREAVGLYAVYASGGRSPQVQARGLYWAGRAALDAGDQALATEYFTRAGHHYDQFHGQLALERLGEPQPRPQTEPQVRFSAADREAFNDNSLVRAARVLGEIGAWRDQTQFLRAISNNARSDSEHFFAAELAREIGRPDLAVMVGRSARINGLDDYAAAAFPTVPVPAGFEQNWTFIHAIARQESQFDRQALSRTGARGLMQLMPATAQQEARRLGLAYDPAKLTTDPQYNIMLGSTFFQQMLRYYGGNYPLAVAAYNAGPGNVNRFLAANGDPRTGAIDILDWIEKIPFSETRTYVQKVLENAVVYETLRPDAPQGQRNLLSSYLGKPTPG